MKDITGIVVSNKMQKTVVIEVTHRSTHPLYKKVIIRSKKYKAHSELDIKIGDKVKIKQVRPISKQKKWKVTEVISVATQK